MTTARATSRRTSLEKHREAVIALLIQGWKPEQVAAEYKVNPSSLTKFQRRHADKLASLRAEVERRAEDYAISFKVNRVAELDKDWQRLEAVIDARSKDDRYDEPGYATGLMAHTLKAIGGGDNMSIVDEFKVDTALVALKAELGHKAAEELAQLARPVDAAVSVNVGVVVALSWGDGEQA